MQYHFCFYKKTYRWYNSNNLTFYVDKTIVVLLEIKNWSLVIRNLIYNFYTHWIMCCKLNLISHFINENIMINYNWIIPLRRIVNATNCLCDELSGNELSCNELSMQRIVCATNCPATNCLATNCPCDELSATNCPRRIVLQRIVRSPVKIM